MARTLDLKALSAALGKDKGQLSRWAAQGMPHDTVGGQKRYDLEECAQWIALRPQRPDLRKPRGADAPQVPISLPGNPAPAAPPLAVALEGDPLLQELLAGAGDPRAIARAAMILAARQVAQQAQRGAIGPQQLDSVKKSLEELRRSEEAWIDIETRRGQLIERDVARAVCGMMAQRLKDLLDRYINSAATQFEQWNQNSAFCLPANTGGRAREIRVWMENLAFEVRSMEVNAIDAMIEKERQEVAA